MGFWSRDNINGDDGTADADINGEADDGAADADINGVSTIINAHGNHAERRENFYDTAKPAFHVADCPGVATP